MRTVSPLEVTRELAVTFRRSLEPRCKKRKSGRRRAAVIEPCQLRSRKSLVPGFIGSLFVTRELAVTSRQSPEPPCNSRYSNRQYRIPVADVEKNSARRRTAHTGVTRPAKQTRSGWGMVQADHSN